MDDKREASTLTLGVTLKGFMTKKDVREERRCQEMKEKMKTCFDIQNKKLEIEESNVKTKAGKLKPVRISKKVEIMTMGLSKVPPKRIVWFEKK
ncbi:hypothetical protein D1007_35317 [Hordeum vulgare]|nr:hypothetical protein D1007_35317 [Hordeum vulgare]